MEGDASLEASDLESDRGDASEKENVPVRKGTMSKDIKIVPKSYVGYTATQVMQRASHVGILFLLLPMITIGAYVTGECAELRRGIRDIWAS